MSTETAIHGAVINDTGDKVSTWYIRAMERLVDVTQDLSRARTLDDVLGIVRLAARDLTGADGATFVLRDGSQCYYAEENAITPLWKGKRFPMDACISGWVMIHAEPVFISDIYKDSRIPVEAYRPTFVKSLAMVPIRQHEPLGAIGNYWARNRTPNSQEMSILQALANITALSIENVKLYAQLENKISDLEESNAELERFAWVASHDLKSPLRAIDNLAGWVAEDLGEAANEAAKGHLDKLRKRTRRMEHMLDDMLEYALMEDHPLCADSPIVDGRTMLDEIGSLLYVPEGFTVTASPVFESARMQRQPLQRVFMNLIGNAIKHHDEKTGIIRLDATTAIDQTLFTISDDGPGIPEEFQSKIFDMFQTLKPRDKAEGSGMGLAIVKKIITARGGGIQVRNQQPRGCVFSFNWPIVAPAKGSH